MSIGDDVVVVEDVKKSKKRKDKGVKVDAAQKQQTTEVDAPKKREKRKREENGEGEERKKKKKRKDTADVPSVEEPSVEEPTPTAVEENITNDQTAPGIDKKAARRKRKELRKELKKQQKALAKAGAGSSSKPAPPIKNTINTTEAEKYLSENAITIHGDVVPVLDFDQLDIQPPLREVLSKFAKPTPIQACAWPALLEGKDVIGIAETGRFVPRTEFSTFHTEGFPVAKLSRLAFRSSLALKKKNENTKRTRYMSSSSPLPVNWQSKPTIRLWRLGP